VPYPIVVDELAQLDEDLALIAAQDVADGIGLKISKAGGLTRAAVTGTSAVPPRSL